VLGGRWSSVAFLKLCGRVPLEKYFNGVSNFVISLLEFPFLLGNGAINERRLQVFQHLQMWDAILMEALHQKSM